MSHATKNPSAQSVEATPEKQATAERCALASGSAEALLAKYMTEVQRLHAQRSGVDRAIRHAESKVEAAREILGLPIKRRRGRPSLLNK